MTTCSTGRVSAALIFVMIILSPALLYSQEYYRSNSLGMELEKIQRYRTDEYEFYLEKKNTGGREIKTLYRNSIPVNETETIYSPEGWIEKTVVREKGSETEKIYSNAMLESEKTTNADKTGKIIKYRYNAEDLVETVDEYTLDGIYLSSVTYKRDSKGRIVSVSRIVHAMTGDNNDKLTDNSEVSKYRFSGQNLLEEWHGSGDETGSFIYYNSEGRISLIIKKIEGRTVSEKKYSYNQDGSSVIEEIIPEGKEKIVRKLDPGGYMEEESVYLSDTLVSRMNDTYEDKKLVKRIRTSEKGIERYLYEYEGDKVSSEKYFFNGELRTEKFYTGDNEYYEDVYSGGKRYLRVYYSDNKKTGTEKW